MQAVNIVGTQTEKTYESRFYSAVSPWDALKDIAAVLGVSSSAAGLPIETLTGYIPAVPVQDAIAHISVASRRVCQGDCAGATWRLCGRLETP